MSDLLYLQPAEQEALLQLSARLLDLDWPMSTATRESITLLWLEWRERWKDSEPSLTTLAAAGGPDETLATTSSDAGPAGTSFQADAPTERSRLVVTASNHRPAIYCFLEKLAAENGLKPTETAFLLWLRSSWTPLRSSSTPRGPYR